MLRCIRCLSADSGDLVEFLQSVIHRIPVDIEVLCGCSCAAEFQCQASGQSKFCVIFSVIPVDGDQLRHAVIADVVRSSKLQDRVIQGIAIKIMDGIFRVELFSQTQNGSCLLIAVWVFQNLIEFDRRWRRAGDISAGKALAVWPPGRISSGRRAGSTGDFVPEFWHPGT